MEQLQTFSLQIVHSPRRKKSCRIQVGKQNVIVTVPQNYGEIKINQLLKKHRPWIEKKITEQKKIVVPKAKKYEDGEIFTFLGKDYPLRIIFCDDFSSTPTTKIANESLEVTIAKNDNHPRQTIKKALEIWYQAVALKILTEKNHIFGKMLGVQARSIKIKDYKSRWGSCTRSKEITYNWRIIIAPEQIVDYLVVHELSHILQHNHSPAFWQLVKKIIPDYKKSNEWLRKNGLHLVIS